MKLILISALVLLTAPCVAGTTEEFTVVVTANAEVELSSVFAHFSMVTSADLAVRFVMPVTDSSGVVTGWSFTPAADPSTDYGTGPRPDAADSTLSVYSSVSENIFNDIGAKKLLFHGTGTVTIKAKK